MRKSSLTESRCAILSSQVAQQLHTYKFIQSTQEKTCMFLPKIEASPRSQQQKNESTANIVQRNWSYCNAWSFANVLSGETNTDMWHLCICYIECVQLIPLVGMTSLAHRSVCERWGMIVHYKAYLTRAASKLACNRSTVTNVAVVRQACLWSSLVDVKFLL
jgi:hypothetical protein